MNWDLWTYRAAPDPRSGYTQGVVDGDTLDLLLDLGLSTHGSVRVRLAGIDTAEKYGQPHDSEEYDTAKKHAWFVENWIIKGVNDWSGDWPLRVRTRKDRSGKYGRLVAHVARSGDDTTLNQALVDEYPEVADE